jgi:hypothetical protein
MFITQVGEANLPPGAFVCMVLIPAKPTNRTSFIVETLDAYFVSKGRRSSEKSDFLTAREKKFTVGYPPVHPHHANSWYVGYHDSLTKQDNSIFRDFWPVPFYSVDTISKGEGGVIQSTSNTPGFNADFLDCHPDFEDTHGGAPNACFFLQLPKRMGFPILEGTDLWSSSLVNDVVQVGDTHQVTWEFARTYVTPGANAPRKSWPRPVWTLDFAVVGNGNTYEPQVTHPAGASGSSVAFHTYFWPTSGKILTSWSHSHAQGPSELWILDKTASEALPAALYAACWTNRICGTSHGRAEGVLGPSDLPLEPHGFSIGSLQSNILANFPDAVRCWYKTTNKIMKGKPWGRSPMRTADSRQTCDGWAFKKGQAFTMLAFNYPTANVTGALKSWNLDIPTSNFEQHHRWWPITELDMPNPLTGEWSV